MVHDLGGELLEPALHRHRVDTVQHLLARCEHRQRREEPRQPHRQPVTRVAVTRACHVMQAHKRDQ